MLDLGQLGAAGMLSTRATATRKSGTQDVPLPLLVGLEVAVGTGDTVRASAIVGEQAHGLVSLLGTSEGDRGAAVAVALAGPLGVDAVVPEGPQDESELGVDKRFVAAAGDELDGRVTVALVELAR